MMRRIIVVAVGWAAGVSIVFGGTNWPQFRGPNGSGIAMDDKPPVRFGPGTNEVFKVPAPAGASSPCVWGDRIFLTGFEDGKLWTLCYSAKDGKRLWSREAPVEKLEAFHPTEGSPAASTPATDGKRVYSYFGSGSLCAYTLDGKLAWQRRFLPAEHVGDFGTGTSPVVHEGMVLVNRDMIRGSHFLALNSEDGSEAWRAERPEFSSSWSTPVIWKRDGAAEVVLAAAQRIKAYDLMTGEERWQFQGLPNAVCPLPVVDGEMLFFAGWSPTSQDAQMPRFGALREQLDKNKDKAINKEEASGMLTVLFSLFDLNNDGRIVEEEWDTKLEEMNKAVNQAVAIRPGKGKPGKLGEENVAWSYKRGLPYVPSGLVYRGKFYMVRDGGMVTCLDTKSGKPDYEQERLGALGTYYASPVAADGRIYFGSNDGKFTVLAAGEKPEVLSRAELGERCVTTPAIAHDRFYVRSRDFLWCFGE